MAIAVGIKNLTFRNWIYSISLDVVMKRETSLGIIGTLKVPEMCLNFTLVY